MTRSGRVDDAALDGRDTLTVLQGVDMGILGAAFKIGRLFGVNIRIHVVFVIWILYELLTADDTFETISVLGTLFFSVVCHEFGHCFGARLVGGSAEDIVLWPLGGLAYAKAPMRPWSQFATVAAGPIVNFAFCIFSAGVLVSWILLDRIFSFQPGVAAPPIAADTLPSWVNVVLIFMVMNAVLFCFNLLPIFPLDGGQLFRAVLWRFTGLERATLLASKVGIVGAVLLIAAGIMYKDGWLPVIGVFCAFSSLAYYRLARDGQLPPEDAPPKRVAAPRGRPPLVRAGRDRAGRPPNGTVLATDSARTPVSPSDDTGTAELDHLMRKFTEEGEQSLSYVERRRLEWLLRQRHCQD